MLQHMTQAQWPADIWQEDESEDESEEGIEEGHHSQDPEAQSSPHEED